jgi:hypothetical protein
MPERALRKDPAQETQLLFNERVVVHKNEKDWLWVEAIDQQKYYPDMGWKGYLGWVESKDLIHSDNFQEGDVLVIAPWTNLKTDSGKITSLSFGTRLSSLENNAGETVVRLPDGASGRLPTKDLIAIPAFNEGTELKRVLSYAKIFLGAPYLWGGCSAFSKECPLLTSVDCSALVHLSFRAIGVKLPRDARDQYKMTVPVRNERDLAPGDLLFTSPKNDPDAIDHVMLYAGNNHMYEATLTQNIVRFVSFQEKFGFALDQADSGNVKIFFGKVRS